MGIIVTFYKNEHDYLYITSTIWDFFLQDPILITESWDEGAWNIPTMWDLYLQDKIQRQVNNAFT